MINEWGVEVDGSFGSDPRAEIWRSRQSEREIWHDHGNYPRADSYNFYLSYHAMLVVAARLLQRMPVLYRHDWSENEWAEWLRRHLLTRDDGRWLADRRDPAPLLTRDWNQQNETEKWHLEISNIDFLDGILFGRKGKTCLTVFGSWDERDNRREESFHVSTALVSPAASQSLLNALTTCLNPYDFKLPDYEEDNMEFGTYPFELWGWIWRDYTSHGLDEHDPLAAQIDYPPYQIGQSIVDKLSLSADFEARKWFLPDTDVASLLCELWSTSRIGTNEDPFRQGKRLSASLAFLRNLCFSLECKLIIKVQVKRQYNRDYYMRNEDGVGQAPPHFGVYILSADGQLRDTKTNYQLR